MLKSLVLWQMLQSVQVLYVEILSHLVAAEQKGSRIEALLPQMCICVAQDLLVQAVAIELLQVIL